MIIAFQMRLPIALRHAQLAQTPELSSIDRRLFAFRVVVCLGSAFIALQPHDANTVATDIGNEWIHRIHRHRQPPQPPSPTTE